MPWCGLLLRECVADQHEWSISRHDTNELALAVLTALDSRPATLDPAIER
jgi:hypothetical protein